MVLGNRGYWALKLLRLLGLTSSVLSSKTSNLLLVRIANVSRGRGTKALASGKQRLRVLIRTLILRCLSYSGQDLLLALCIPEQFKHLIADKLHTWSCISSWKHFLHSFLFLQNFVI
uniref:Uncharacterized protein n=1 Tax=Cacopsylla melanoneura TaxID=428564 RepID=A0A8D8WZE0_9HEMI